MAKITRYPGNLKAFAADALGTERTIFGDTAQADDLASNITADFLRGWGIVGVNENPTKQDFNGLAFTLGQLIAYLHQMGVSEWDDEQEYAQYGFCIGSDGKLYQSQIAANIGNDPTTDGVNWISPFGRTDDITVTVGSGGDYATINAALEDLSQYAPAYKAAGVTATISLLTGFVMAEQVLVRGLDLGWITITGVDASTSITHTALTTDFTTADYAFDSYPAFGVSKGGVLPRVGQLFIMSAGSTTGQNKHGVMAVGAGSCADILPDCGVQSAGSIGIYATFGSTINANSADASSAGTNGIFANRGSTINANSADASSAGTNGIFANRGSTINARDGLIQNQTTGSSAVGAEEGSHIEASSIDTTGTTVTILSQAANTLTGDGIIYQ